jgi:hypothetical protein
MIVPSLVRKWATELGAPGWSLALAALVLSLAVAVAVARAGQVWYRARVMRRQADQRQAEGPAQTREQVRARAWERLADRWTNAAGLLISCASMYNLFGFLRDHKVPVPIGAILVLAYDGGAIGLIASMYRLAEQGTSSKPAKNFSRLLVLISAAANFEHAGTGLLIRVIMGSAPILAAAFIEHNLRIRLYAKKLENGEVADEGQPGPVRLVVLLWRQAWARIFVALNLDAAATDSERNRTALVQHAARCLHELRRELESPQREAAEKRRRGSRRAAARLAKLRTRAQAALDRADVATDPTQALALVRRMSALTRADDMATADYSDTTRVMTLIEDLAVMPSAERIAAGARAEEAERRAADAEQARQEAEEAKQQAQAEAKRVRQEAAQALAEAQRKREAAEDAERARQEADSAWRTAQTKRKTLAAEIEQLQRRAEELRRSTEATDDQKREAAATVERLHSELRAADEQLNRYKAAAEEAQHDAQQALAARRSALTEVDRAQKAVQRLTEEAETLQQQVEAHTDEYRRQVAEVEHLRHEQQRIRDEARQDAAQAAAARQEVSWAVEERRAVQLALKQARDEVLEALTSPEAQQEPQWRSEAKTAGWELYKKLARAEGREPTDAELAEAGDRDESTARHWRRDFRRELARLTAAALPAQPTAHSRTADEAVRADRTTGDATAFDAVGDGAQNRTVDSELAAA